MPRSARPKENKENGGCARTQSGLKPPDGQREGLLRGSELLTFQTATAKPSSHRSCDKRQKQEQPELSGCPGRTLVAPAQGHSSVPGSGTVIWMTGSTPVAKEPPSEARALTPREETRPLLWHGKRQKHLPRLYLSPAPLRFFLPSSPSR